MSEPGAPVAAPTASRNPLSAGGWSGLSFIAGNLIGSVVYYPLARLLHPEDFGLVAEANLVYLAAVLLAEGAVAQALVQMQGDRQRLAQSALWLSAALGILGSVLCVAAAPLMVIIYGDDRLLPLLIMMAPGVFISALGAAPHALLARELDFRRKTLPETASVGLGGIAGLAAAVAGLGLYSLAVMTVTQNVVSSVAAWRVCRPRPRPAPPDGRVLRRMAAFTGTLGAGDLALYARLNTDYALTGRLLGAASLGIYTIAWATSSGPQLFISAFTSRVGYATFARLQHDRAAMQRAFLISLRIVAAAAMPVSLGAVLIAPDLVPVLLGSKWRSATTPLMVLFLLQLVRTVSTPGATLVLAMGRTRLYAVVGAAALPATVIAVLAGTRAGVTGVAWAMLVAVGGTSLVYLTMAVRLLAIRGRDLLQALTLPIVLSVAALPPVALVRLLFVGPVEVPALVRLLAAIFGGLAAASAALRLLWPSLRDDLLWLRQAVPDTTAPAGSLARPADADGG